MSPDHVVDLWKLDATRFAELQALPYEKFVVEMSPTHWLGGSWFEAGVFKIHIITDPNSSGLFIVTLLLVDASRYPECRKRLFEAHPNQSIVIGVVEPDGIAWRAPNDMLVADCATAKFLLELASGHDLYRYLAVGSELFAAIAGVITGAASTHPRQRTCAQLGASFIECRPALAVDEAWIIDQPGSRTCCYSTYFADGLSPAELDAYSALRRGGLEPDRAHAAAQLVTA